MTAANSPRSTERRDVPGLPDNVVLTGFMGTGKTTVARLLAERLGRRAVDADDLIEERHGSIAALFAEHGEGHFRRLEREVAAELARERGLVISTGGRMLLDPANASALQSTGKVFCLTADVDELVERLRSGGDSKRPLLGGADLRGVVVALLAERADGYGQFEQVDTTGRTPAEVANVIAARIRRQH